MPAQAALREAARRVRRALQGAVGSAERAVGDAGPYGAVGVRAARRADERAQNHSGVGRLDAAHAAADSGLHSFFCYTNLPLKLDKELRE